MGDVVDINGKNGKKKRRKIGKVGTIKKGRQSHKPTAEKKALVSRYATDGARAVDIAGILKISDETLRKYYRKELDEGHALVRKDLLTSAVTRALNPGATNPETSLMIFLLKTMCGLKEQVGIEHTSPDGSMSPQGHGDAVLEMLKAEKAAHDAALSTTQKPDPVKPPDAT